MRVWIGLQFLFTSLCLSAPTVLIFSSPARAKVGRAYGEIEFEVTRRQIQEVMNAVQRQEVSRESLCICPGKYQSRDFCQPLQELEEAQVKSCQEFLIHNSAQILSLVSDESELNLQWGDFSGQDYALVARGNRAQKTLTVDLRRFRMLSAYQRVQKISAALLPMVLTDHTVQTDNAVQTNQKDQTVKKDQTDQTIEVISAAITTQAIIQGAMLKYDNTLKRSQSHTPYWFDWGATYSGYFYDDSNDFGFRNYRGSSGGYRLYWSEWGLILWGQLRRQKHETPILVDRKESIFSAGLGVSYKTNWHHDPMLLKGQTYLCFDALIHFYNMFYDWKDAGLGINKTANAHTWGPALQARVFVPMIYHFWFYAGAAVEYMDYGYKDISALSYHGAFWSTQAGLSVGL